MAKQDGGRWITIAGQHIFVEEGETPMSAYVRQTARQKKFKEKGKKTGTPAQEIKETHTTVAGERVEVEKGETPLQAYIREQAQKPKYKKLTKEIEKRDMNEAKERNFKENEKLLKDGNENKFRMIGSMFEEKEKSTDNWQGLGKKDKERIKEDAINHLNQRIRALGGDEDLEKNKEKYADAYVQYRVDRITDMKKKRRLEEMSDNKAETNEVDVKSSSSKTPSSIEKSKENQTPVKKENIIIKETTSTLNKKLNSDDTEGMNSGTRYQENKFGVKDQALLYDENERPSNSWIPTKQAMITYYKKRAKKENNQYYSDNAERLAEEYIKYREELKKKGRN